jgi:hypothetical protein
MYGARSLHLLVMRGDYLRQKFRIASDGFLNQNVDRTDYACRYYRNSCASDQRNVLKRDHDERQNLQH